MWPAFLTNTIDTMLVRNNIYSGTKTGSSMMFFVLFSMFIINIEAFVGPLLLSQQQRTTDKRIISSSTICNLMSADTLATIGYAVTVNKPMGVVFGENRPPFFGLVIDEIIEDGNGANAGLRVGDQLLTVEGKPVVGRDFDTVMTLLREGGDPLELDLYRGSAKQMYTIMMNLREEEGANDDEDEESDDDEIIMDENYESPVTIDMSQYENEQSLSVSASNVMKNLGKMFSNKNDDDDDQNNNNKPKKKGMFDSMFSKDTIQLDFEDGK